MASPYKLHGGALRPDAISGLNADLLAALNAMYAGAPPEVQAELGLTSAFRDINTQRKLWEDAVKRYGSPETARKWVAEPGKSKHNTGEAVDLYGFGLSGNPDVSQATKDWVRANAGKHGLAFPMEHEPWHIELAKARAGDPEAKANVASTMKQAGYSDDQIRQAFLSTIAGTESPGYDVLYGGSKFTDYSQHPNQAIPIESGPNKGKTSSAAGRYQFLYDTWADQQKKLGLKDFSPGNQDIAAWDLAATNYKNATGGDLMEALKSNDPGRVNAAASILAKTWTSLPGGIEQSKGYGTSTFADAYQKALAGAGAGSSAVAGAGAGAGAAASASPYAMPTKEASPFKTFGEKIGEAVAGIAKPPSFEVPPLAPTPAAARVDQPAMPVLDPAAGQNRRAELAAMLARLNAGSLV